ncbi:hypothetical protein SBV1_190006 [Verrucomicrobia bacterium]|nr:hypothetical protein SBV1_190006 [Verrucomicrobiota bacterium]
MPSWACSRASKAACLRTWPSSSRQAGLTTRTVSDSLQHLVLKNLPFPMILPCRDPVIS